MHWAGLTGFDCTTQGNLFFEIERIIGAARPPTAPEETTPPTRQEISARLARTCRPETNGQARCRRRWSLHLAS